MTRGVRYRESELPEVPPGHGGAAAPGRKCISVIGIDRYRQWPALGNAVSDAEGVLAAFERLGFVPVTPPLVNDAATFEAIRRLPDRLKPALDWNDSLVVFFAGHGHTTTIPYPYGPPESKGYLIPVDADRTGGPHGDEGEHTWHRIEPWLSTIAELRARHVLVILDSCHSGIALGRPTRYREAGVRPDGSSLSFHERLGRWVLTSALAEQKAMDDGPIAGHSVFTGYLIQALGGGATMDRESSAVSIEEVAGYVRRRVLKHSNSQQVPDLGWLEHHSSGQLLFGQPGDVGQSGDVGQPHNPHRSHMQERPAARSGQAAAQARRAGDKTPRRPGPAKRRPRREANKRVDPGADSSPPAVREGSALAAPFAGTAPPPHRESSELADRFAGVPSSPHREDSRLADRTEGWELDPPVAAALDRQGEQRRRAAHVLTVIAGDALAAHASWGTWAAQHGYLTLATQSVGFDEAVADLLAQTPWLRCVPEARKRLAAAARIDVASVDASLDARSMRDQRRWVDDIAPFDPHARVGGWLLSSLRRPTACVPDVAAAPVPASELLAIACDLASPTAVLLFHPTPDERWLERAIVTAAQMIPYLPAHSVAVTAPDELVARVLDHRRPGAAFTMARQGLVKVESRARRIPGRARHSTMRVLFEALARDPRTPGFELDGKVVSADGPPIDVALVAHGPRIAVELDAWYHFHDPEGYRRDRVQDTRLQRAGYFVLRFPAEDVDDRLASTIEHVAIALAGRRAARALP